MLTGQGLFPGEKEEEHEYTLELQKKLSTEQLWPSLGG